MIAALTFSRGVQSHQRTGIARRRWTQHESAHHRKNRRVCRNPQPDRHNHGEHKPRRLRQSPQRLLISSNHAAIMFSPAISYALHCSIVPAPSFHHSLQSKTRKSLSSFHTNGIHASNHLKSPSMNCPNCGKDMTDWTLDGRVGTQVNVDVCTACQSFWFDQHQSLQLFRLHAQADEIHR